METLLLFIRMILAGVLAGAGIIQIGDLEGSRRAVCEFGLPRATVKRLALLLPAVEIALALTLLPATTAWVSALATLALFLICMVTIGHSLARGHTHTYLCFGQLAPQPVSSALLMRTGVFTLLAAGVVMQGPYRAGPGVVGWFVSFSSAPFLLLVGSLLVAALLAWQGRIVVKSLRGNGLLPLEYEAIAERVGIVESSVASKSRLTAPALGMDAPAFRLPNLKGEMVELSHFSGKPALLLFWNPHRGFCRRMLGALQAWEVAAHSYAPRLVLISTGTVEANQAQGLSAPILLDDGFVTGRAYGVQQTPSAILVDAQGRVASPLVIGASAIMPMLYDPTAPASLLVAPPLLAQAR